VLLGASEKFATKTGGQLNGDFWKIWGAGDKKGGGATQWWMGKLRYRLKRYTVVNADTDIIRNATQWCISNLRYREKHVYVY